MIWSHTKNMAMSRKGLVILLGVKELWLAEQKERRRRGGCLRYIPLKRTMKKKTVIGRAYRNSFSSTVTDLRHHCCCCVVLRWGGSPSQDKDSKCKRPGELLKQSNHLTPNCWGQTLGVWRDLSSLLHLMWQINRLTTDLEERSYKDIRQEFRTDDQEKRLLAIPAARLRAGPKDKCCLVHLSCQIN